MTSATGSPLPHNAQGRFEMTIEQMAIDAEAARYRAQGLSYREIATVMACDVGTAHGRVKRALAAVPVENVTELRRVELERMDTLTMKLMAMASTDYPMVSHGRVIPGVKDLRTNLVAIRQLLDISESRRKLLGLDAPVQVRVTVTDEMTSEIERLAAELGVLTDPTAPLPIES